MNFTLQFNYDNRGRGNLTLLDCGTVVNEWLCRTGSINSNGELVNALKPGLYLLKTTHEETEELPMVIDGQAWKTRLYTFEGDFTHLLIHPDGGKGGTLSCIGVQSLALDLRDKLDEIIKAQKRIFLNAGTK